MTVCSLSFCDKNYLFYTNCNYILSIRCPSNVKEVLRSYSLGVNRVDPLENAERSGEGTGPSLISAIPWRVVFGKSRISSALNDHLLLVGLLEA
jgi:hypothetical protein